MELQTEEYKVSNTPELICFKSHYIMDGFFVVIGVYLEDGEVKHRDLIVHQDDLRELRDADKLEAWSAEVQTYLAGGAEVPAGAFDASEVFGQIDA